MFDLIFALFGGFFLVASPIFIFAVIEKLESGQRTTVIAWGLLLLFSFFASLWLAFSSIWLALIGAVLGFLFPRFLKRFAEKPDFVVEETLLGQAESERVAAMMRQAEQQAEQQK